MKWRGGFSARPCRWPRRRTRIHAMTTLRRLAAILIHPRRIMREILDAPRDRMFVVVFMLAMISGAASDTSDANVSALRNMPAREQWIACAAVIAVLAISVVALFVF